MLGPHRWVVIAALGASMSLPARANSRPLYVWCVRATADAAPMTESLRCKDEALPGIFVTFNERGETTEPMRVSGTTLGV